MIFRASRCGSASAVVVSVRMWVNMPLQRLEFLLQCIQRVGDVNELRFFVARLSVRTEQAAEQPGDGNVDRTFFVVTRPDIALQKAEQRLLLRRLRRGLSLQLLRIHFLLRLLRDDLACAPRDDVQVDDRVQNQKQVHRRDGQQVNDAGGDAPKLLRM